MDEIKGDVINTLSETHARLDSIVTLMTNQHDAFAAAHPLLINTYELVQQGLARVVAQIQANTESINLALEQMASLETVIDHLNSASIRLMRLIEAIDPNVGFENGDD